MSNMRHAFEGNIMIRILRVGMLCSLVTLPACQEKLAQGDVAKPKAAQSTNQGTPSPGKPRAPVHVEYQVSKNIQPGIAVVIRLRITPLVDAQQINLHYRTEGALTSGDPQPQYSFGPTPARTTVQRDITVIPQAQGRYRVIVSIDIASQGGHAGNRSMSIPIVAGNPPPASVKPQGTKSTDSQGKPVIVTPAQEEIIRH